MNCPISDLGSENPIESKSIIDRRKEENAGFGAAQISPPRRLSSAGKSDQLSVIARKIMGIVWGAQVLGADSGSDPRGGRKIKVFPKSQNPFQLLLAVCGVCKVA